MFNEVNNIPTEQENELTTANTETSNETAVEAVTPPATENATTVEQPMAEKTPASDMQEMSLMTAATEEDKTGLDAKSVKDIEVAKKLVMSGRDYSDDIKPGNFSNDNINTVRTISKAKSDDEEQKEAERRKAELELYQSKIRGIYLTDKVFGFRPVYDNKRQLINHMATVMHGPYIVYIPVEKFTNTDMEALNTVQNGALSARGFPEVTVDKTIENYFRVRIGAEINYIVDEIPTDDRGNTNEIVSGDRVKAMRRQRIYYWYGKINDDVDFMKVGDIVEARVISVSGGGMHIEIFGVETHIDAKDLSWDYVSDARKLYSVGDKVNVKIMEIERNEENDYAIHYKASVRKAMEDPRQSEMARKKYYSGGIYRGEVTNISLGKNKENPGVFVKLEDGISCRCPLPYGDVFPYVGNIARIRLDSIRKENGFLYGTILDLSEKK
jgi:predicted RNA-binding protein with RPS1 domain